MQSNVPLPRVRRQLVGLSKVTLSKLLAETNGYHLAGFTDFDVKHSLARLPDTQVQALQMAERTADLRSIVVRPT
ncbi:hypothetical protein RSO01_90500 [Reyranella soli]|uniref:Uncharacterized protein n=1 Tax=Reyranella soli TaxID=1230389 RepID=A0A512NSG5_9HYPH|nr:hypothetical protein RSO01_90500 [Reyranella soli]